MRALSTAAAITCLLLCLPAARAACFDIADVRSAVILSGQDVLMALPDREVLVRLDGICPGLVDAGDLWLLPADGGRSFCGAGDGVRVGTRVCDVLEAVDAGRAGRDCFRGDRLRAWSLAALDRVRVVTREGSFDVGLAGSCPELSYSDSLRFRSSRGLREVCGGNNDVLLPLGARTGFGTLLQESAARREHQFSGAPGSTTFANACVIRSVDRISARGAP
jgi:hypothetical protein